MLRKRVLTCVIGLPILILAIWFGTPWFSILLIAAAILGLLEFYRLATLVNIRPLVYQGIIWAVLLLTTVYCHDSRSAPLILTAGITVTLIWLLVKISDTTVFGSWFWTVGGVFYIGWMLTYWLYLRDLEMGKWWVFWAFSTIFATDISAFFIGSTWGKHAMAPSISPKKTWEGAIGGLASSIFISALFGIVFSSPVSWWQLVLMGAGISVFAQIGDLIESLLKRNTHVKDAGNLLPGHGGILDRLDSLVFSGAFVYYTLLFSGLAS